MANHERSLIVKIILLPVTIIAAVLSLAFWLLSFRFVRKLVWKGAKNRVTTGKIIDVKGKEKKG